MTLRAAVRRTLLRRPSGHRAGAATAAGMLYLLVAGVCVASGGCASTVHNDQHTNDTGPGPQWSSVSPHTIKIEEYAPAGAPLILSVATHIEFAQGLEIITEKINRRFTYRAEGLGTEWLHSPLTVNGPHSVAFNTGDHLFYSDDTVGDRLIAFADITRDELTSATSIAGVPLSHPHNVVYDPIEGFVYAINPNQPIILRFRSFGVDESALDLSQWAGGYSRSLSIIDGTLYVAATAKGAVIEVHDFETGRVTVHPSHGKKAVAALGAWETTGFVINDVEFYDGYWYVSNFFTHWVAEGTDAELFKVVRFRTWEDLATGRWQDLGHLLADTRVPYFFTVHGGSLYMTAIFGTGVPDVVYKITNGLFLDDFESGTLEAWGLVSGR